MTSRLAKQLEAYRMARRIVRACNRMKAGQGVALQWCAEQRHVLRWMMRKVGHRFDIKRRQREAMKRQAMENVTAATVKAVTKRHAEANAKGWPTWLFAAHLESVKSVGRMRVMELAAIPAREFCHDRPELDPKRRPKGVKVGVNRDA